MIIIVIVSHYKIVLNTSNHNSLQFTFGNFVMLNNLDLISMKIILLKLHISVDFITCL